MDVVKILKVINNNVVSAYDDAGKEIVVMGKGIGFHKSSGDLIDEALIEKKYSLPEQSTSVFEELVKDIPYEYIKTAAKIIKTAKEMLGKRLNKNIYITLTDHLNFAITRAKQNVRIENALLWEIRRFYHQEFNAGMEALKIISEDLGIDLCEDEAGFFALHIVNAEMDACIEQTIMAPDIIKDILNIVSYTFSVKLDEESIYYERFINHLKFLLERIMKNQPYGAEEDELNSMVKEHFPKSYRCALRIRDYLKARVHYEVGGDELTYLTMHIQRNVCRK